MINKSNAWPIAIAAVLGLTVVANGFLLYEANKGDGAAIEQDYYRKAVQWDSTAAQARRNVALGWHLVGSLDRQGRVSVQLLDPAWRPLDGARISLNGFAVAHTSGEFSTTLTPGPSHRYEASVRLGHPGLHEIRFNALRGADRFTATLRGEPGGSLAPRP